VTEVKPDFLGLPLDRLTMGEAIERIEGFVRSGIPRKIFCPNVALLVWSRRNADLRRIYRDCDLLPADGMAIYYASRLLGDPIPEMVSGSLLFFKLLELAAKKGYRVYFFGTTQAILETAVANLRRRYPGLQIAGYRNGFFSQSEAPRIAEEIRESRPDFLFVGMSTPLKECFVDTYQQVMQVPVSLGVGGSFDIAAGVYKFAPRWMRVLALEWLYRLIQEPRRMWKRYLTTNSVFLYLVGKALLRRLISPQSPHTRPTLESSGR
jgi:N-acetylglucosaminyldiphosphoundecaprenol N-acetyl-beta-D-mannosaminyltransferase